jgi:aspartate racemase
MKTIGIVGGITWHSSIDYYRLLNEMVSEKTGGAATAKVILYSLDFGVVKSLTEADRWDELSTIVCDAAAKLENAGAHCILIGANTMHKIADSIQRAINIPLIHIAEVTANAIAQQQLKTVALLGTKYTMQLDFYKEILAKQNITTIIPLSEEDIEYLNYNIYNVMGKGIFSNEIKQRVLSMIDDLIQEGAEGIILGCTELPILIKQVDCPVPIFDTVLLHAKAAVEFALELETIATN